MKLDLTKERIEQIKAGTAGSMIVASNDTIAALCDLALAGLAAGTRPDRSVVVTDAHELRVLGVSRDAENDKVLILSLSRPAEDDELRGIYDRLRAALSAIDVAPAADRNAVLEEAARVAEGFVSEAEADAELIRKHGALGSKPTSQLAFAAACRQVAAAIRALANTSPEPVSKSAKIEHVSDSEVGK